MKSFKTGVLAAATAMLMPLGATAQDQADLITPVDRNLTFVFVPKVIHPWYDVVAQGAEYAAQEFAQRGIDIEIIWDQPPMADVADQNQRIEANIGRRPDGLAVACLDCATNVQLMNEARDAGIFASNASNPIGAARAVKNAGKAGEVAIVGMDDLPEAVDFVCSGVISALKAQRQWDMGYWAVYYMVAMNENHTIPMFHNTGSRFLTKSDCTS